MTIRSRLRIRTRLRAAVHRIWPPEPKPLILMYHRISDPPIDPWGLAVSPLHFEEQLHILRRTRQPFALAEFVDRLLSGALPSNAVALTFDDGYVDNLTAGKELLARTNIPATVFLATGYIDRAEPFWWDELSTFLLRANNPQHFELVVRGNLTRFDLDPEPTLTDSNIMPPASSRRRHEVLRTIWQTLRKLRSRRASSDNGKPQLALYFERQ